MDGCSIHTTAAGVGVVGIRALASGALYVRPSDQTSRPLGNSRQKIREKRRE
jgi:hypothetical protein